MLGDSDFPKLSLKAVAVEKKKRSSTESGSSSEPVQETMAIRLKRTRRTAVSTAMGGSGLDPIMEESAKPKKTEALAAIPEAVVPPSVVDLGVISERISEGTPVSGDILDAGDQGLLVSLTGDISKISRGLSRFVLLRDMIGCGLSDVENFLFRQANQTTLAVRKRFEELSGSVKGLQV